MTMLLSPPPPTTAFPCEDKRVEELFRTIPCTLFLKDVIIKLLASRRWREKNGKSTLGGRLYVVPTAEHYENENSESKRHAHHFFENVSN